MAFKGYEYRSERRRCRDGAAERTLWRVTGARSTHHHLFFGQGTWSADGSHLLFISYRTGFTNLHSCDWGCGLIRQMTARVDLNPFSAAPSPVRREIFYTARDEVRKVHLESLEEASLGRFRGARVGNCSVDPRGDHVAVSVRWPDKQALAIVRADGSGQDIILEKADVSRSQFCPSDASLLLYSSDRGRRLWSIRADGTDDALLYEAPEDECAVHETWLGRTGEVIFVSRAGRLSAVHREGGSPRTIVEEGIWHVNSDREGTRILADSRDPRRGILLIDPSEGKQETLCRIQSTGRGRWWKDEKAVPKEDIETATLRSEEPEAERAPCDNSEETEYGPEWTHLHPVFDPAGERVTFTSDRRGRPQVYTLEKVCS